MTTPLASLLQIADSAFPTGAFAYSSGLEALARAGRFTTFSSLESYLDMHLQQAVAFDLSFVAAAHAAGRIEVVSDGLASLEALCDEWDATQWNSGMRTASLRQARALIDALIETFDVPHSSPLYHMKANAARPDSALHFVPCLGFALATFDATREQVCTMYLHGLARDQTAAAVRLGIVGPRAAQTMQARAILRVVGRLGDASRLPGPRDARRTAPLVETGQGAHGFLYSRLFQN